ARGETQEAMLRTLGFSGISLDTLNAENERFVGVLEGLAETDPGVEVKVANALFGRAGIPFREKFLRTLRERYGALARNLDFGDPLAVAEINRWVREKTEGKIEAILERLDPDAILILLNTLFFRGSWSVPFEEKNTRPVPFHFPDGTVKDHPTMFQSGWYRYLLTDAFQAVSLPYGKTGQIRLYLFLPAPQVSLRAFLAQLSAANWARWKRGFERRSGTIGVPRFRLSYGVVDLKEVLRAMGMEVAFSPQADFGNLVDGPAFIEHVFHRTVMEVDEKGTEAAAATAVVIAKGMGEEKEETFTMVIDRPFFLVLLHEESNLPLFMGAVFAPQE
ncbi:MAG: serpin family protein, partial [Candidatus Caldatribacteriaceae bacterium]